MPTMYVLAVLLALSGCNNNDVTRSPSLSSNLKVQDTVPHHAKPNIHVKDESLYGQSFLDKLSEYKGKIELVNNYIIVGTDTTYFPENLPLNKTVNFKGIKDESTFTLSVKRINLTDLNYEFTRTNNNKKPVNRSGQAILAPMFFLASEIDEDAETAEAYASSEYLDNSGNCSFSIRIGIGKDDNGKLRAKLMYDCKENIHENLTLEESPTLRTETVAIN